MVSRDKPWMPAGLAAIKPTSIWCMGPAFSHNEGDTMVVAWA